MPRSINTAIAVLAKAFSGRGIADGVQVTGVLPGPVKTRVAALPGKMGTSPRDDSRGGDSSVRTEARISR